MSKDRPIYVIDTNILVDYVDVIPGGRGVPEEPTIDLSQAHLVIPTVVVRELSNFKGENSDRGKAARTVLKRLRALFEGKACSIADTYNLRASIQTLEGKQEISIMPVHKNFRNSLPFHPNDNDMDGQIILTALATSMAKQGMRIDGTELIEAVTRASFDNVTLLTNDNGLAIRARERGLMTSRYGYKHPDPYTGRRDIVVPNELFKQFYNSEDHTISRAEFMQALPNEPELVANEFLVMRLADPTERIPGFDPYNDAFFDSIGRYDADQGAIVRLKYVRDFPTAIKNPGQAMYAEALVDPNIAAVICTGPAGSGKTYMATIFGYKACLSGRYIGVTTVPCENRSKIGALPGDLDEKMDPDVQPLKNALRNYVLHNDKSLAKELENVRKFGVGNKNGENHNGNKNGKNGGNNNGSGNGNNSGNGSGSNCGGGKQSLKNKLADRVDMIWDNHFSSVPIEVARGRDFAYEVAIYDEFQDQNAAQADTLIKRIGRDGKIILTGDVEQIHAPYLDQDNNGLVYASRQMHGNKMVAQVHFTEDEVVRHPLVREIARRQKNEKARPIED